MLIVGFCVSFNHTTVNKARQDMSRIIDVRMDHVNMQTRGCEMIAELGYSLLFLVSLKIRLRC